MSGVEFVAETPQAPAEPAPAPVPDEELPATGRPQRLGRRSLTSRLVVGVVSLVLLLVFAIGTSTFFALRSFLYGRIDDQVHHVSIANAATVRSLITYQRSPSSNFSVAQKVWVAVLDRNGTPADGIQVNDGPSFERMDLTTKTAEGLIENPDTVTTVRTTRGETIRASAHRIPTGNGGLYVVSGLSLSDTSQTMRRTLKIELVIGVSAVALALLMTYVGVRFSLRGLRRVTTTVQEVAAELGPSGVALQRRVPVTEEGTEVAQLTDSMNTLLQATETQFAARVESEERMRQFLADASHELRTPLTSIRGYAELARMQRAAGDREAEDNLGRIEAEGTRMSRLVEDLLMLARGDGAGSAPQRIPIDIDELVHEAVNGAHAAFPERPIGVDATVPNWVHGDPDQLLRVVRNLITNAAVHTRPGAEIRVRAFTDGPWVGIQVVDGGPGLPPEEASHVFERFWRADKARTRARGGSGLGLSIVAAIVQAHGGTVRFDSSVEAGSTVTIWLPAAM